MMFAPRSFLVLAALAVLFGALAVGGCSGGTSDPQSIASEERVDQIVQMRALYDKVGGDWDKLTAEDKAEYTRLAGDEKQAETMWKAMATPPGAIPGQ